MRDSSNRYSSSIGSGHYLTPFKSSRTGRNSAPVLGAAGPLGDLPLFEERREICGETDRWLYGEPRQPGDMPKPGWRRLTLWASIQRKLLGEVLLLSVQRAVEKFIVVGPDQIGIKSKIRGCKNSALVEIGAKARLFSRHLHPPSPLAPPTYQQHALQNF